MIRRALLPLIATCAALGVGIALGGGPLSDHDSAQAALSSGHTQADLAAQTKAGEKLAAAAAPLLLGGKLSGQHVAMLAMPGAPATVIDALAGQVAAAGGVVVSTLHVTDTAVDPASKSLVDTLGAQMATQVHGVVDAAQPPYVRLGQMIGGAVATTASSGAPSADQATTLATLDQSKLVTAPSVQSTASLALIVLGDHVDPTILAGIVQGAASRAHGVVVAGSTGSGLRGDLTRLRRADLGEQARTVATVDGDETNTGQVATILALVHQIAGGGGAYGASGIDGVAPLG